MRYMLKRFLSRCASVSIMRRCTPPIMKSFVAITSLIFFVPIIRLLRSTHKISNGRRMRASDRTRNQGVYYKRQRVHKHSDDVKQKERMQKLCSGSRPLSHAFYRNRRKSCIAEDSFKPLGGKAKIVMRFLHFIRNKRRRNKPYAARL